MNMTKQELIDLLQADLKNEYTHMHFYLQAAVMVRGLHREELSEFFMKEAQSELLHCEQFARFIVHLGAVPVVDFHKERITDLRLNQRSPVELLKRAIDLEQEVANNYNYRLCQTEDKNFSAIGYAHVFYEEQLADSQKTAWELEIMIQDYEPTPPADLL